MEAVPLIGVWTLYAYGQFTGFLEYEREDRDYLPVEERVRHYREFVLPLPEAGLGAAGRPLHELRRALLPRHKHAHSQHAGLPGQQSDPRLERPRLHRRLGRGARNLHSTNNFPEVTGRVCPAPCEALHAQHRR